MKPAGEFLSLDSLTVFTYLINNIHHLDYLSLFNTN